MAFLDGGCGHLDPPMPLQLRTCLPRALARRVGGFAGGAGSARPVRAEGPWSQFKRTRTSTWPCRRRVRPPGSADALANAHVSSTRASSMGGEFVGAGSTRPVQAEGP